MTKTPVYFMQHNICGKRKGSGKKHYSLFDSLLHGVSSEIQDSALCYVNLQI